MDQKNIEIVVAPRGWVFIGEVNRTASGLVITDAKVIRRWGTSKGLGQLALEGPQPNTQLDAAGTVTVPAEQVLFTFDVDASKWAA